MIKLFLQSFVLAVFVGATGVAIGLAHLPPAGNDLWRSTNADAIKLSSVQRQMIEAHDSDA